MRLATANICSNPRMLQRHVVHDLRKVARFADVIGWQEIAPPRYRRAMRAQLPAEEWQHIYLNHEVPISFRIAAYELVGRGAVMAHPGKRLVCPNRWITWAILRRRGTDERFAVVNSHYVSGAWSRVWRPYRTWRRARWVEHWQKQRDIVTSLTRDGLTVLVTGDFNRVNVRPFVVEQTELSAPGGIDHVFACPAPGGLEVEPVHQVRVRQLYSDHDARVVKLWLKAPEEKT